MGIWKRIGEASASALGREPQTMIAQVEAGLLPVVREYLDEAVAEQVMAWSAKEREARNWARPSPWSPSSDIVAAWQVVERLIALRWTVEVTVYRVGLVGVKTRRLHPDGQRMQILDQVMGITAPEAICRAAFAAVRMMGGD